ncbi:hypothetical protein Back2_00420 [Nocardioides baekrokdamisoli]|uniref:Uncharacterized protein n=1 Tax=Nocardioides baekrokdamisoli TaxID=1804624 RepID=A0A3G9IIA8_9ACTN|nr:hypothetical protein [Nocardioides baekrokdamisoli]BBH15755.1 hypothetical protein Back2_00420 [Nocardioides baekrokdamisoli]
MTGQTEDNQLKVARSIETASLLTTLGVLLFQSEHVASIHEEITYGWDELDRTATMRVHPDPGLFDPAAEPRSQALRIPFASRSKGSLLTLGDVASDAGPVTLMTHQQHIETALQLIRLQAALTYGSQSEFVADMKRSEPDFLLLVSGNTTRAHQALARLFDDGADVWAPAASYTSPADPTMVQSFASLCRHLADAYLIIAEIWPKGPNECTLTWTTREPSRPIESDDPSERRRTGFLLRLLNDDPVTCTVEVPLSKWTKNYHVKVEAPPGTYARAVSVAVKEPPSKGTKSRRLPRITPHSTPPIAGAAWLHAPAPTPFSHTYIENGVAIEGEPSLYIEWAEFPLGAMLGPFLAAAMGLILAVGLAVGRSLGFFTGTGGTLIVLAIGGSLAPVLTFAHPSNRGQATIQARAATLALTLLAFAYSSWWALPKKGYEVQAFGSSVPYTVIGLIIIGFYGIVALWCWWKLRSTLTNHKRVLTTGVVSITSGRRGR